MTTPQNGQNFATKYTNTGLAGRILLNGFFSGVQRWINQYKPTSFLEVGCGEGFSTLRLAPMLGHGKFTGLDIDADLVRRASNRNPQVELHQGSVYNLAHNDNSFDMVGCMEVLEHLKYPENALQELSRVARRWVLLSVPREPLWRSLNMARGKYWGALGNTPGHIQNWSKTEFLKMLRPFGEPIRVHTPLPWTQVLLRVR